MSGVEILGIAASVLQIAELGGRLSVKLFTFGRKIKNADKNIDSISQEIAATGAVLQQLGNTLEKDDQRKLCSDEAVTTARDLVAECHKVFSELEDSLDGRSSSSKLVSIWKNRLKYPFLEPQIDLLRSNLERLKSSLLVMLNILVLAGQIKSQEALPILEEQRTLIKALVDDSAANNTKFNQVMKRLEGWNMCDPVENQENSRGVTFQQQINFDKGNFNHKVVSKPTELKPSTNACTEIPHYRLEEITDHSCLVSELVQKIKAAQGKINLGLKKNLHERVLDVHWEEWSTLRGLYGEDALMQSFSHHEEVFWTSKTEKEALNIQRDPVSSNPAYSDFMTMRHNLAPMSSLIDGSSSLQHQSNYTSMNENTSTMQAPSIPHENPVIYTPTTHRVSKAKKGKRIYACEFPGCGKVFTRAEHKRRHEGNHNSHSPFSCTRSGCRQAFHRPDLLERHLERHDIEPPEQASGYRRRASIMSCKSVVEMGTMGMKNPMTPITATVSRPHSGPISIGSLVNQGCLRGSYGDYPNGIDAHASSSYPYSLGFPSSEDLLYYSYGIGVHASPSYPWLEGFPSSEDSMYYNLLSRFTSLTPEEIYGSHC